nr:hypothetical protein [Angustibacter aerolatus]
MHERPLPEPPELDLRDRGERAVDAASGASAAEPGAADRRAWARRGACSRRRCCARAVWGCASLRRTAQTLDVDDATAAVLVEVAYAAGLVADDGQVGPSLGPHPRLRRVVRPAAARALGRAGRRLGAVVARPRPGGQQGRARHGAVGALAGRRAPGGPRPAAVGAGRAWARSRSAWRPSRRRCSSGCAGGDRGGPGRRSSRWRGGRCTRPSLLGVTGRGGLGAPGRALVEGRDPAEAMATLLPEPVDHVLLQADLTAVAPGPLETQARPAHGPERRRRVARRRHGLPVLGRLGAPGDGRRVVGGATHRRA